MAGRITEGPNVAGLNDNFSQSFVTASDGKPALAVVNTDGTTISGGGGGGGGLSVTDQASFTAGTSSFTPSGGEYTSSPQALTSGTQGTVALSQNRGFQVNLRNNAGTELATTTNPVVVTGNSPLDTTTAPTNALVVSGESNDGTAQYNPIPLGTTGRSVIIEGFAGGTAIPTSGGGLSVVDEASWTGGTSNFTPTGGFFNDSATALTSGQQGTVRLSPDRAVSTYSSYPALVTATWTTATTINTAQAISTVGQGTITVTTVETGTTTTAGALTFEVYDGTNWWAVEGQQIGSYTINSSYTLVNGTNVAWQFDVGGFQQFRVRLSTAITGTGSPQVVVVVQATAGVSDNTPTVGWGQRLDNVNDSITAYQFGHSYAHIAAGQATTTVKSGAGVLLGIIFNGAATATNVTTIYDNTAASGTVIGIPAATAVTSPTDVIYGLAFSTGLTILTATANGADMTIIFR